MTSPGLQSLTLLSFSLSPPLCLHCNPPSSSTTTFLNFHLTPSSIRANLLERAVSRVYTHFLSFQIFSPQPNPTWLPLTPLILFSQPQPASKSPNPAYFPAPLLCVTQEPTLSSRLPQDCFCIFFPSLIPLLGLLCQIIVLYTNPTWRSASELYWALHSLYFMPFAGWARLQP